MGGVGPVEVMKNPNPGGTCTLAPVARVALRRSYEAGFSAPGALGPNPSPRHTPAPFARPLFGEHYGRPSGSLRAPQTAKELRPTPDQKEKEKEKEKENRNLRTSGDGEV